MEANTYAQNAAYFRRELLDYAENIFCLYHKELVLRLEEYNLLQNKLNCMESSTAIGFVLEEFVVAKLEMWTDCSPRAEFKVLRNESATTRESHDCYAMYEGIKYLINVKVEKSEGSNNAVAAIGKLYESYVEQEPEQEKSYVVLKIRYTIAEHADLPKADQVEKPRHILILGQDAYSLEQIDFSQGHHQDHRSWSAKKSAAARANNGRLTVSPAFLREHLLPEEHISYRNTCQMLKEMVGINT